VKASPGLTVSKAADALRALDRARLVVLLVATTRKPVTVADLKTLRSAAGWLGGVIASVGAPRT
jgi:hypothetical protein